jgi:hypothetical protein
MEVVSATHLLLGSSATLVALEQIRSCLDALIAVGGSTMAWALSTQPLFSHQTCYLFASTMDALRMQLCMHTGTAIHTAIVLKCLLHFFSELCIFSAMLTGSPFTPGIVSTHGYFQHPAHRGNRILLLVRER